MKIKNVFLIDLTDVKFVRLKRKNFRSILSKPSFFIHTKMRIFGTLARIKFLPQTLILILQPNGVNL